MKKVLSFILVLALAVTSAVCVSFAEDAAITADGMADEYIVITDGQVVGGSIATNASIKNLLSGDVFKYRYNSEHDPQIEIKFDSEIDITQYPYIAIKAKEESITGSESVVGYYNELGSTADGNKAVTTSWTATDDWQWVVFDLSSAECNVGYLRFDPKPNGTVGTYGAVAGVFAFASLEQLNAFAESDAGKALGSTGGEGTIELDKTYDLTYLYAKGSQSTGWWVNPYNDAAVYVDFTAETWFCGINIMIYASKNDVPFNVYLIDDTGSEVGSTTATQKGDGFANIIFYDSDGHEAKFQPGSYEVMFETSSDLVDEDEMSSMYIVFGSGDPLGEDEMYVEAENCATNGNTKDIAALALIDTEAGEITTKAPTAAPTATPDPTATPAPTEAPTAEPTAEPAEDDTATAAPASSGCGSVISGTAALTVLAAAFVVLKKKRK